MTHIITKPPRPCTAIGIEERPASFCCPDSPRFVPAVIEQAFAVWCGPSSKVVIKFLQVMMRHGYIGEFEFVDDHRAGKIVVELNGRLNKCGVISPRYDVQHQEIEHWLQRLLPSRQFGVIVITTSAGIMDHDEARRKGIGGKILGFFY
ncbi:hypothetical protein WJX84_009643 [Apatococcus fuscideae]|uniref:40S ribosomal protein S15a n=1 Tax=Apatococcus fuscideae TaxID=2026836 RepID=A0AAW1SWF0_9CHLO